MILDQYRKLQDAQDILWDVDLGNNERNDRLQNIVEKMNSIILEIGQIVILEEKTKMEKWSNKNGK